MLPKRVVFLVYNDFDGDSRVQRTAQVAVSYGHDVFVLAKASNRYPPSSEPRIINGIKVLHVDESSLNAPSSVKVAREIRSLLAEATKLRIQDLMRSLTRARIRAESRH